MRIFVIAFVLVYLVSSFPTEADVNVSVGINTADFSFLADYGSWVDVTGYGRVWRPSVAAKWRPFYYGDWTMTDQGWTWVSYEPYGWAVYHYGNWHHTPNFGWVWIPGYDWSPARVSWIWYGDQVAWAPLAPRGVVLPDPWVTSRVRYWHVVPIRRFTNENVGRYVIRTNLVKPVASVRIVRTAPAVVDVERVIGRKVEVVHVRKADVAVGARRWTRIEYPDTVARRVSVHRKTVERDVIVHGKKGTVHTKKTTTVKEKKKQKP